MNKAKKSSGYIRLINRPISTHTNNDFSSISLFSGILGIEIGLERAGFKTLLAVDHDSNAKDVVEKNRKMLGMFPYICGDINDISPEQILKLSNISQGEVTILAGGPPCQPFSKSGLRKGVDDERGLLFKSYLDYLEYIKPQSFILENVRGLYSSRKGEDFKLIINHFDESGYTIYWKILDAANFGVPQFRQRLFMVGFRERIRYNFPKGTNLGPKEIDESLFSDKKPYVTVENAIGDLTDVISGPKLTGKYAHLVPDIPEGLNYSFYSAERNHPKPIFKWRSKFWYFLLKVDRSRPSLTIQAYPGNNTGPFHWQNRKLAIEELGRLQSFPDWLKINKPYMTAHRLIGNALPPLLSEALGISILSALRKHEEISIEEYLNLRKQNVLNAGYVKSGRGSGKGKINLN